MGRSIAVIPPHQEFLDNRIFEAGGPMDRDGVLAPWLALRRHMAAHGVALDTVDRCAPAAAGWLHLDSSRPPPPDADPARTVVMVFEPQAIAPYWYRRARREPLPYASVHVMSLELVRRGAPLELLRYPQVVPDSIPSLTRDLKLVMINNRKRARIGARNLYGRRERVAAALARSGNIDVFGAGWGHGSMRHPLSAALNLGIRRSARGPTPSKVEILARARFALCFENSADPGYHTEKLFDAMLAGAVPIYLGDPRITDSVPPDAFIDFRELRTARALRRLLDRIPPEREQEYRAAATRFLAGPAFEPYSIDAFVDRAGRALDAVLEPG
jgi:alpha(1,3/1,4) fucosyltransferase